MLIRSSPGSSISSPGARLTSSETGPGAVFARSGTVIAFSRRPARLLGSRVEQLVEALLEARHAFALQLLRRRRPCRRPRSARRAHDLLGGVDVGVDAASQRAVVGERLDRRVGQRVDGVRADQLVDVQRSGYRGSSSMCWPTAAAGPGPRGRPARPTADRRTSAGTAGRPTWPGRRRPCPAARAPRAWRSRAGGRPRCRRG